MGTGCISRSGSWVGWAVLGGLALAGCGGGGGGGGPKSSFSFTLPSGTAVEGGAPLSLGVVLHTSEVALPADVQVDVVDAATGTASAGGDYSVFAPVTLVFPAGSVDGATQQVPFSALDDLLVEGTSETVRFTLANAVGAGTSGQRTFTATLTDIHVASLDFASASSVTPDESTAPRNVAVRLDLPPGASLGLAVSVRVADAGGGSASPGNDYHSVAATNVSFPAGSADGAQISFAVGVMDDNVIEVDETVRLSVSQPSAGATLGANVLHQLTIADDDASGPSAFVATEGATGTENSLVQDEVVGLGTQSVGGGPTTGTLLRVTNAGGGAMDLGAPRLAGSHPGDFSVVIESAPLSSAPGPGEPGFQLAPDVAPPWAKLGQTTTGGVTLSISQPLVAELSRSTRATLADFPAPGFGSLTLALERKPLPLAAGAVLRVDGVDQPGGLAAAVGDLSIWTGHVLEVPGAKVFLAISSQATHGWIELPERTDRFVHLFTEQAGAADGTPALCRVVRGPELASLGALDGVQLCGGELEVPGRPMGTPSSLPPEGGGVPPTQPLTAADCQLALETDYQFYQKFNSTLLATNYVTQLIAAISAQYVTDVQTTLSIAYLGLYSTPADPWTAQDSGGDASDVLDQFRTAWNTSGWPASANLAHFLSGASLGGGVAYVNVLCNQSFGFGVSGNLSGSINWQTWTGAPGNFTWDFVVVAHELGHNFGSNHTHSFCPPLDLCSTNCNGTTSCSQGTIMSYCHTCGGMDNIDLEFHPVCANVMRQAVNSSCLGLSALAGGDHVQYQVRFDPTTTGARTANLEFTHDATNVPSPFRVVLTGTGN